MWGDGTQSPILPAISALGPEFSEYGECARCSLRHTKCARTGIKTSCIGLTAALGRVDVNVLTFRPFSLPRFVSRELAGVFGALNPWPLALDLVEGRRPAPVAACGTPGPGAAGAGCRHGSQVVPPPTSGSLHHEPRFAGEHMWL